MRTPPRLAGIDIARALAFGGMLLAHFAVSYGSDPGWLQALDNVADGRAAPLFCVLLGLGAGVLLSGGRTDGRIVRRGAALFGLGLAIWPLVPQVYVILPHYGVLLAVVPLLRRLPHRVLLPVAGVAFAIPSLIVADLGDSGLRAGDQPGTYGDLLDVAGIALHLAWTGGYPLLGWVGFVLVGLWLARLSLRTTGVQVRLAGAGMAMAALQPLVAWAQDRSSHPLAVALLERSAHSNQLAWYVLSSASAAGAIGVCLLVAVRMPRVLRPVERLGRVMLSAYVTHLVIGVWAVWDWHNREPSLTAQVVVAVAVFVSFALVADWWVGRRRSGPVEALLRAVAP